MNQIPQNLPNQKVSKFHEVHVLHIIANDSLQHHRTRVFPEAAQIQCIEHHHTAKELKNQILQIQQQRNVHPLLEIQKYLHHVLTVVKILHLMQVHQKIWLRM